MIERKVFILDTKSADALLLGLNLKLLRFNKEYKGEKIKVDIKLKRYSCGHLPLDYDIYIIHPSDTDEEAIKELRKEQPWCRIYARTGHTSLPTLTGIIDGLWGQIDNVILRDEIINLRCKKEDGKD